MYLTLAVRILCWITAVPLLFVAVLFAENSFDATRPTGQFVGAVIFFAFALAPGIPLAAYYVSGAFRRRYQRDILAGTLHIKTVAEKGGVQWSILAFPDRLAAPGVAVVAIFLQNAHSTGRVVAITLRSNPFERGGRPTRRQRLEGGEVGVLRLPLRVPESAPAARHELTFDIEVRREGRIGARVTRRDGLQPRRLHHSRHVEIEVLGRHDGETTNEMTLEWAPFQRLFGPGQALPDLEPIRVLESL